MRVAVNQGSLDTGDIAKCPRRFVAVDQRWRIIEGLLYHQFHRSTEYFGSLSHFHGVRARSTGHGAQKRESRVSIFNLGFCSF